MGLLRTLTKFGMAKKVYDEARKPANRARLEKLARKVTKRGRPAPT